jgi:predicted transcriptional regulator
MSTDPRTVAEDASLEDIVELMERYRIKRVPVLCGGEVVGIVTRSNLMRAMVSVARAMPPTATDDMAIREHLMEEIQKAEWAPGATIEIVVRDGIVEFWGVILDERQRDALKVAAENIAGVKTVKDHLVWVEPMSGISQSPDDVKQAVPRKTAPETPCAA